MKWWIVSIWVLCVAILINLMLHSLVVKDNRKDIQLAVVEATAELKAEIAELREYLETHDHPEWWQVEDSTNERSDMDKYNSATRNELEDQINNTHHELSMLKQRRHELSLLEARVTPTNIVLECEDYKFAYGDDFTYCEDHDYENCGCEKQHVAFIGYKSQNGLCFGYYPYFVDSCKEYKGMDRFTMFLVLVGRALNFITFREDISNSDERP